MVHVHCAEDLAPALDGEVELVDAEERYTGGAQPAWVLSNHDVVRHATRYGSEARARAAAVLLLCVRGTPFLYAGEELGLVDAEVGPSQQVDPGGRDGCRAPIPWDDGVGHGWPTEPWLPFPPDAGRHNVASEQGDPTSMLEHYRRLLLLRRNTPALHSGACEVLDSDPDVLRWRRIDDVGNAVEIEINFVDEQRASSSRGTWIGGTRTEPIRPGIDEPLAPNEARITAIEAP
jgi:alpha-glucosidase